MANLAVKVADLDAACRVLRARRARRSATACDGTAASAPTCTSDRCRSRCSPAPSTRTRSRSPTEGFLHPALFTDDLDAELAGHDVVWGPAEVEGPFGRRRIAFVAAPGGIRLEFMEQLGGSREGHPLPPRVGELPRRPARRHGRVLRRPVRPRRRPPTRHPRRRPATGTASATSSCTSSPRRRAARPSTRPATTTASRSTTSTPPSPSSRPGASSTSAGCRVSRSCRSGSTTPPATPSSCSRTEHRRDFTPYDRPVRAAFVGLGRIYDLNVRAYRRQPRRRGRRARRPERGATRRAPARLARRARRSRRSPSWRRAGSRSTRSRRCSRSRCTSTA